VNEGNQHIMRTNSGRFIDKTGPSFAMATQGGFDIIN
jgi:hypothetical protein